MMMKKSMFAATLFAVVAFSAYAQGDASLYEIPNGHFTEWTTDCERTDQRNSLDGNGATGISAGLTKRPGEEPASWSASNFRFSELGTFTTIGSKLSQATGLVSKGTSGALLVNKDIQAGRTPTMHIAGFLSLNTPWIFIKREDYWEMGTYGGVSFAGRPDAISGKYKRKTNETATGEQARIVAYLWKGTYKSKVSKSWTGGNETVQDEDRAILYPATAKKVSGNGSLIASCDYAFASTKNNGWEEITVPLDYKNEEVPEKMNVIISSGDYWNKDNIKAGNQLEVEYVEYVYYPASISNCRYNGHEVAFDENDEAVLSDDVVYEGDSLLTYDKGGNGQIVAKSFDAATGILLVTVTGGDYGLNGTNQKTYTIRFSKEKVDATLVAKEATKYGTFYAQFDVQIPENMKAYTCSAVANNELVLVEQTDIIPAFTPVIVETTGGDRSESLTGVVAVADYDKEARVGLLQGVLTRQPAPNGSYVMQNQSRGVKFYLVDTSVAQPNVPANRCYLQFSAPSEVKVLSFPGEATAIEAVNGVLNGTSEIYDLSGRRLPALQKGVNIVNGKKVLVK